VTTRQGLIKLDGEEGRRRVGRVGEGRELLGRNFQ